MSNSVFNVTALRPIRTNRLVGVPLRRDDFQEFKLLYQDPLAMRYLGGPRDETFCYLQLTNQLRGWKANGFGTWVFRERVERRFVGICGFFPMRYLGVREIGFGYMLIPQFWHRGLGTEIARVVLGVAFGQDRIASVIADIPHHNSASRRLAIRLGFHFERNGNLFSHPHMLYRATRCSSFSR
jgi:[ribosomal protein S5]-alanine N-acetyltransferase